MNPGNLKNKSTHAHWKNLPIPEFLSKYKNIPTYTYNSLHFPTETPITFIPFHKNHAKNIGIFLHGFLAQFHFVMLKLFNIYKLIHFDLCIT